MNSRSFAISPLSEYEGDFFIEYFLTLERVTGIEPVFQPWEGRILPLNHTRINLFCFNLSPINIPMVMKKQEDDSSLMG